MDYPVDRQYFINQNREVRFFKWNSFPPEIAGLN